MATTAHIVSGRIPHGGRKSDSIRACDADGCVPYVGTEEWTSALGFKQIEAWRPWLSGTDENMTCTDCITAGYVTTYSVTPQHNFTFITIKGAGHM